MVCGVIKVVAGEDQAELFTTDIIRVILRTEQGITGQEYISMPHGSFQLHPKIDLKMLLF